MTPTEIAQQLSLFIAPDQVTELRALHVGHRGRTFAGWFTGDRLEDMARQALALSRQAAGVYFIPNPIDPAFAAKRLNRVLDVHRGFTLTSDAEVIERRHLIVDLDPRRSRITAEDVYEENGPWPSSARELAFARRIARRHVIPFLADLGLGRPVEMISGNGVHLVYQIPPSTGTAACTADPFAFVLRRLSEELSCWAVTIDANTYNPCRMLKVPGTIVRRGEPAPGRPYRTARIVRIPDGWTKPTAPRYLPDCRQAGPKLAAVGPAKPTATKPTKAERPTLFESGRLGTAGH